ncbi:MAG: hypothetical protein ACTS5I_14615, partial [Rhodanobacter sp.]
ALAARVFITPLLCGFPKQRHVQQVGLAGVDEVDLLRCQLRRYQPGFDGIGMQPIVDFGQVAADVPAQLFALGLFQALELFDEVNFEFRTDPMPNSKAMSWCA